MKLCIPPTHIDKCIIKSEFLDKIMVFGFLRGHKFFKVREINGYMK